MSNSITHHPLFGRDPISILGHVHGAASINTTRTTTTCLCACPLVTLSSCVVGMSGMVSQSPGIFLGSVWLS